MDVSSLSLASLSSANTEDFRLSETGASPVWSPRIKPVQNNPPKNKSEILKPLNSKVGDLDITSRIMTIIQGYGQNEENSSGDAWLGRFKFEARVRKAVDHNTPILLVLPAFPWKSVNKVEKVLGALPDLGEVLALGRLNNLCEDIEQIYEPGARVTITSDGLVYNDLLGIPDEEVYEYGAALRRIPAEKEYVNIDFIRIMNLLGLTDQISMTKEEYLQTVGGVRETLVERFLDPTFIATDAIEEDRDINLTYCGYLKFLAKDLKYSPVTAGVIGKNEYRRAVKRVAQDMIIRGKAFAAAIDWALPDHVRLSIHRSTGLNKLSFPLVPQINHFSMTPWHCCIAVTAKGEFRTAHKTALVDTHDLVEHEGRPSYFRDRSSPAEILD
ncbi:Spore wall maturation protein DIT1 [Lachnellula suecica]|uniref:Spore wall maturation protein DIT1 n=1 Tax=Lachnellula suecica TaxID=602035 RepID=A0A8T9BZW4_9HELO|nr:Spore wall maturation protein DIT1 [Lachnellula suecica]